MKHDNHFQLFSYLNNICSFKQLTSVKNISISSLCSRLKGGPALGLHATMDHSLLIQILLKILPCFCCLLDASILLQIVSSMRSESVDLGQFFSPVFLTHYGTQKQRQLFNELVTIGSQPLFSLVDMICPLSIRIKMFELGWAIQTERVFKKIS